LAADEANRNQAFEIWAKSGLPDDNFAVDFDGERFGHRLTPPNDDFVIVPYKSRLARAKAYGPIKKDVDVDGWLEPKHLDRALKDLGLDLDYEGDVRIDGRRVERPGLDLGVVF
jgi:sulfonate transport system substrate-binding protein